MGSETKPAVPFSVQGVVRWIKTRPKKQKSALGAFAVFLSLLFLYLVVEDHDTLFITAEFIHWVGLLVLIYKLLKRKTCVGLSAKSQLATAAFLSVRLYCSFWMEYDTHTLLDFCTLVCTGFVLFCMFSKLRSTYQEELDSVKIRYVLVPCALLALVIHPTTPHSIVDRILWAFCVYLEAVSVLPQLQMIQNTKVVEPYTAHYVFSLGVARFLSCAHWLLQVVDPHSNLLAMLGSGAWPVVVLVSEIVQTFILADFCYYYVKSIARGESVVRIPSGIV
eukprot:jgi/Mesvir1/4497/Mv03776-RA.1